MKPGEIPISDAADICKRRGLAYVIVFGVREDGERFHVTTYGKTKKLCKLAGAIGGKFADAVLDGRVVPPETEPMDVNEELLAACKVAASAAGKDWLQMQLMLAGAISKAEAIAKVTT